MSRELNDSLARWAAQAGAQKLSHLKRGDHMAHVTHGVLRYFGRVEGFSVEMRPDSPERHVNVLRPGSGLRIEPVVLMRTAVRVRGKLMWAQACQWIRQRELAQEWRFAETTEVRDLLAEMDGYIEPPRRSLTERSGFSAMDAIDLAPDKGR